jgi:hypothetical protein
MVNEVSACCPGILLMGNGDSNDAACCVGGTISFPPCFLFCDDRGQVTSSVSCKTKVPITATDYSARVFASASTTTLVSVSLVATTTEARGGMTTQTDTTPASRTSSATQSPTIFTATGAAASTTITRASLRAWLLGGGAAAAAILTVW